MLYPVCIDWGDTQSAITMEIPDIPGIKIKALTLTDAYSAIQITTLLVLQEKYTTGMSFPPPSPIEAYCQLPEYQGRTWSIVDINLSDYFACSTNTPHEVIYRIGEGVTPIRAWREYLRISDIKVAQRLNIPLELYAEIEIDPSPIMYVRTMVGAVLGIPATELEWCPHKRPSISNDESME